MKFTQTFTHFANIFTDLPRFSRIFKDFARIFDKSNL